MLILSLLLSLYKSNPIAITAIFCSVLIVSTLIVSILYGVAVSFISVEFFWLTLCAWWFAICVLTWWIFEILLREINAVRFLGAIMFIRLCHCNDYSLSRKKKHPKLESASFKVLFFLLKKKTNITVHTRTQQNKLVKMMLVLFSLLFLFILSTIKWLPNANESVDRLLCWLYILVAMCFGAFCLSIFFNLEGLTTLLLLAHILAILVAFLKYKWTLNMDSMIPAVFMLVWLGIYVALFFQ